MEEQVQGYVSSDEYVLEAQRALKAGLHHSSMANEERADIERQLRQAHTPAHGSSLDAALNVMCAQMELAHLLTDKGARMYRHAYRTQRKERDNNEGQ